MIYTSQRYKSKIDLPDLIDFSWKSGRDVRDYERAATVTQAIAWFHALQGNPGELNAHLTPTVSGNPAPAPDVTVPTLLDRTMTYQGAAVTEQMSWPLLSWHLRNYAAHDLAPQSVLVSRYEEIVDALLYALFLAVDV